jgi:integrase
VKPLKRANGSGSVVNHGARRRKPYEARITTGRDADGKQRQRAIGWYTTRDEALAALIAYNHSPYDIDFRRVTFADLYSMWLTKAKSQGRLSPLSIESCRGGYNYCRALYDIPYASIRANMMRDCVDNCGKGYATENKIKFLFHQLDSFAMELDIINKRYSDLVHISAATPKTKTVFSDDEVANLWKNYNFPWADTALILLYSGWRISELLGLRKENIEFGEFNTMRGGVKTKAGKDRIVPIHSTILPLVKARFDACNTYLIEIGGYPISDTTYRRHWKEAMKAIGAKHTPHDCRHTFRTWFDNTDAKRVCIDRIMGHASPDIGSQKYTHKTIAELSAAIELIGKHDKRH